MNDNTKKFHQAEAYRQVNFVAMYFGGKENM
jgi:hypothetical protein